jgi:hypothetical protein
MIKFRFLIASLLAVSSIASAAKTEYRLGQDSAGKHILVNNCILCRVNGKVISACDVMKKMDVMFYKQFPEYALIPDARYQFYQVNWKHVLEDLIDKELVLADAEENKLPVSNGDIRQEMESIFGPNIIQNLDKINLSYEEAWKNVQADITVRRMIFIRVNQKAMKLITPQDVRTAYEQFAKENLRQDEWTYYVVSIRDADPELAASAAETVHHLLQEKTPITELAQKIKESNLIGATTTVNISQEYKHTSKDISEAYKNILATLTVGEHSQPTLQKSKDKNTVYRLFYLQDMQQGGMIPFAEVSEKLKNHLIDLCIDKETDSYLKRLRKHFDVQDGPLKEMLKDGFQPFALK